MSVRSVRIQVDGCARGNPGPAGAGVVVASADDGSVLFEGGFFLGEATNNVAEYRALLKGLSIARSLEADTAVVYSDSELLVRQMNGQYRVRNDTLRDLFEQAGRLSAGFKRCTLRHVSRADNTAADSLANRAVNLGRDVGDAEGDL